MPKKKFSTINLFIRSLLFSIYTIVTMIPYSFICLASFMLPVRYRFEIIRAYLRVYLFVLKKLCYIDYKIKGLENIPKDTVGIIMSKHQSTWETFMLPIIFRNPAIIIKSELLWVPFFGWGLAMVDPISINRNKHSSAMQQIITKGKKCLDDGRWILIFPEGTRISVGQVGHYKLGGARLATATGYPVIPVAHNAGKCWPKRKFIKQPGTITMVIGPLIESKNRSPDEVLQLTKDWIENTILHIDGFINKSPG